MPKKIQSKKKIENYLAFLDVNPNAKGHTLCIPKQEINKIFDIHHAFLI